MNKWIKCSAKLPKVEEAVNMLMRDPEEGEWVSYGWICKDGFWYTIGGNSHDSPFAWQPLPEILTGKKPVPFWEKQHA
jgi:hypothetical protein